MSSCINEALTFFYTIPSQVDQGSHFLLAWPRYLIEKRHSYLNIDSRSFIIAMLFPSLAYWLSFGSLTVASAIPTSLIERQDGACTNTARTRQCWSNGYSISTDFDAKAPPAGTTVTVRRSNFTALMHPDIW